MADSYGSETEFTFTSIRGAGDTTWDQSEAVNFTTRPDVLLISGSIGASTTAADSAGHYVDIYMSFGPDTTRMSGGWAGGDDSYDPTPVPGGAPSKSLRFLGRVPYGDSTSSSTKYDAYWQVPGPIPPYAALVSFNSGITLASDTGVKFTYQTVRYST